MKYLKYLKKIDPSFRNVFQLFLYPGIIAILFYRLSHLFWKIKLKFIATIISCFARFLTGIEIHPACKIGKYFFIDHGMGVVIGETCIIGDYCLIYQGVTLGANKKIKGQRHPIIKNHVTIGANSTLLGNIIINDYVTIGANSIITKSIEKNKKVIGRNELL